MSYNYSILNNEQAREYNRAQTVQTFFEPQSGIYSLSPAFSEEVSLFFGNNKKLLTYIPVKKERGDGVTKTKAELKKETAVAAGFVCSMTTAYANKIGDSELKSSVAYTESVIERMKDSNILGFVNALTSIVSPLLVKDGFSEEYSITESTLHDLTEKATAFNSNIGKARVIDTNSGIASRNINKILAAIRGNIVQFNLLIAFFKEKYPDFVEGYRKAILISDTGIHHSGIEGIIRNSSTGAPVKGVTITGEGKDKKVITGADGVFKLIKFRSGMHTFAITAPGYESQSVTVHIIRRKLLRLDISIQTQVIEFKTA